MIVVSGAQSKTEVEEVKRSKRDAVDTGWGIRAGNDVRYDDRLALLA